MNMIEGFCEETGAIFDPPVSSFLYMLNIATEKSVVAENRLTAAAKEERKMYDGEIR